MRRIIAILSIISLFFSCGSHKNVVSQESVLNTPDQPVQVPVDAQQVSNNDSVQQVEPEIRHVAIEMAQSGTWKGDIQFLLDSLCSTSLMETTQLGLYVYDMTADEVLFSLNENHRMRPASCEKIITSVTALDVLGEDYQFKTQMYVNGTINDHILTGDVFVKGGMDPALSKKDVAELASELVRHGIDSINGSIYLDTTVKDDDIFGWGWCWDDDLEPLSTLTVDCKNTFVNTFVAELKRVGVKFGIQSFDVKEYPNTSLLIATVSHTMDEVLNPMMKNSDNYYAESMFYQLAFKSGQKRAGRKQATKYINSLIQSMGLPASQYKIADGSGLSLYNYVSPYLLTKFLMYAYNKENIRTHFFPSLPVMGVDGTLKKRLVKTRTAGNVFAKTGTVDGISSLSGYANASNNHVLAFCIINQGVAKSSIGRDFQDKVCSIVTR